MPLTGGMQDGGKSSPDQTGTEAFSSHTLRETGGLHGALFLDTLTSTGRRQNSQPITTSVIRSVSKVDLTELYDAFDRMTWHTPGAFQYACSVHDIKEVKVPLNCAFLTAAWTEHYQADDLFTPYRDRLVKDSLLDIQGIEYVLHQGKVRAQGSICVPLSVMAKVCKATHALQTLV